MCATPPYPTCQVVQINDHGQQTIHIQVPFGRFSVGHPKTYTPGRATVEIHCVGLLTMHAVTPYLGELYHSLFLHVQHSYFQV